MWAISETSIWVATGIAFILLVSAAAMSVTRRYAPASIVMIQAGIALWSAAQYFDNYGYDSDQIEHLRRVADATVVSVACASLTMTMLFTMRGTLSVSNKATAAMGTAALALMLGAISYALAVRDVMMLFICGDPTPRRFYCTVVNLEDVGRQMVGLANWIQGCAAVAIVFGIIGVGFQLQKRQKRDDDECGTMQSERDASQ